MHARAYVTRARESACMHVRLRLYTCVCVCEHATVTAVIRCHAYEYTTMQAMLVLKQFTISIMFSLDDVYMYACVHERMHV